MAKHKLDTSYELWNAMKDGSLRFVVLLNDRYYQTGDEIEFTQLDRDPKMGYATATGGRFSTNDLTFRLGWCQQGGLNNGIQSGYAAFQLEEVPQKITPDASAQFVEAEVLGEDDPFPNTASLRGH